MSPRKATRRPGAESESAVTAASTATGFEL